MAYNFKSIADVDVINNPSDSTNVLIEEDGFIKRIPKSAVGETAENMISKIGAVEVAETVTDSTNVLIEEDGAIKRVSKDKVVPANVVTSPVTASVGQTIVVKAINETGKPIEWEAADIGIGYDAIIDLGVFSDTTSLSDLTGGSIPAGTVKMIEGKIAAGEMPKLMGIITYQYYDEMQKSIFEFTAVGTYGQGQVRCYCDIMPYTGHYSLYAYLRDDSGTDTFSVTKL